MLRTTIENMVRHLPGKIGFYYKDIHTGAEISINEDQKFIAASVIKIPVMIETLKQINEGKINAEDIAKVCDKDRVPSCGALSYMHSGLEVTIKDLYTLMIILSDNMATNILMKTLGIEKINETMKSLGTKVTRINRLLFDEQEQKRGKENYFSPREIGILLEKIDKRELVSPEVSKEMERVLKLQQINSKIPYLLPREVEIAHKTGEDEGITHDVGIVYGKNPFILCFASNDTEVVEAEEAMRKITLLCFENQ